MNALLSWLVGLFTTCFAAAVLASWNYDVFVWYGQSVDHFLNTGIGVLLWLVSGVVVMFASAGAGMATWLYLEKQKA
jgi:hypothetical protein